MTVICQATIDGTPVPKARPRVGRGGNIYTPSETVAATKTVGWLLKQAMKGNGPIGDYDIVAALDFWPARRGLGDADNYAKLVLDAGNHIVFDDDRQVVTLQVRLHYDTGEPPRTEVLFATVGPQYPPSRRSRPRRAR